MSRGAGSRRPSRHLRGARGAAIGVVAALGFGTAVAVTGGYAAERMDLDPGAVWIVNDAMAAVGRSVPRIASLDSVLPVGGTELDAVPLPDAVAIVDRAGATLDVIDAATGVRRGGGRVPADAEVSAADGALLVHSPTSGAAWSIDTGTAMEFATDATPPDSALGGGSAVASTPDGTVVAVSPQSGEVRVLDPTTLQVRRSEAVEGVPEGASVTVAGGTWAILADGVVRVGAVAGGDVTTVDLAEAVGADAAGAVLQTASDDAVADGTVLVGVPGGLLEVAASGVRERVRDDRAAGGPASPVVVDGCAYAAWDTGGVWSACDGDDDAGIRALEGAAPGARPVLRTDGASVVLNDAASGLAWAVGAGDAVIGGWSDLLPEGAEGEVPDGVSIDPPETDAAQRPPVALDDVLGARAGTTTVLPVLLNDTDANGDVLVVTGVDAPGAADADVRIAADGRRVLVTPPAGFAGELGFTYTVDDGRGGTAEAAVTVPVRVDGGNAAPEQQIRQRLGVAAGGTAELDVLGDWIDPDGDPVYLASAVADGDAVVSSTPEGRIRVAAGARVGEQTVTLVVSDGRATASGTVVVDVREPGAVPLVLDGGALRTAVGRATEVPVVDRARGGTGAVRLVGATAAPGVDVVVDESAGTVRVTGRTVGTSIIEISVTDGERTATGPLRIDVDAPVDVNSAPVTVPHAVFLRADGVRLVDVLATDHDPAGGVLSVTEIEAQPDGSVLEASVVDRAAIRVALAGPLEAPRTIRYAVDNGFQQSDGQLVVVDLRDDAAAEPPVAVDDRVTTRVGGLVDVAVLANDRGAAGGTLVLDEELVRAPADGVAAVSGDRIRVLAPDAPGEVVVLYRVLGEDGQSATGRLTVQVRERDLGTNAPPAPSDLTARVAAGGTVRIAVPLSGRDPDGDAVRLLGIAGAPTKGAVTAVGPDWFEYRAGAYSAGTDEVGYTLVDTLGAEAVGTVRIGVAAPDLRPAGPVAEPDEIVTAPSRTVSVDVLANDLDPAGGLLRVVDVEAPDGVEASTDGRVVTVRAPDSAGRTGVVVTVADARDATASAFLTVVADPAAPPARPVVGDVVLGLADIVGRSSLDIDVRAAAFLADGPTTTLLTDLPGAPDAGATLLADGRIRVAVGELSRIVPFRLANPEAPERAATAFIHVPGLADTAPQLRADGEVVRVASGDAVDIDLDRFLIAAGGAGVRVAGDGSARSPHAERGDVPVVGDRILRFRSADGFAGLTAVTVRVADASRADSPTVQVAIPVLVVAASASPPSFPGAVVELEPGQSRELDLLRLTDLPAGDDGAALDFTVSSPTTTAVTARVDGDGLRLAVAASAVPGAEATVPVRVRGPGGTTTGEVSVRVVSSQRPLAAPAADALQVVRGSRTTLDVLANDEAANPFPETPLEVVAVQGTGAASLPAGVSIVPAANGASLVVTTAPDATTGRATVRYQVLDATRDRARAVWGVVRVDVQDVPDPVRDLRTTAFGDRSITVAFDPGAANGSPVTGYTVTLTGAAGTADAGAVLATTVCPDTVCTLSTRGNGQRNAVDVRVAPRNVVGEGAAVSLAAPVWSDVLPPAPADLRTVPLDSGVRVSWTAPDGVVGTLGSYLVTVGPVRRVIAVGPEAPGTPHSVDVVDPALVNGTAVDVVVRSRSDLPAGDAGWRQAASRAVPAGPPAVVAAPTVSAATDGSGSVRVDITGVFRDNGAAIGGVAVALVEGEPPRCTGGALPTGAGVQLVPAGRGAVQFDGVPSDRTVRVVAYAVNRQGCTATDPIAATTRTPPEAAARVVVDGPVATGDGGTAYRLREVAPAPTGAGEAVYRYRLTGDFPTYEGTVRPGGLLAGDGRESGRETSVQILVCVRVDGLTLCADRWSEPQVLGAAAAVRTAALAGADPQTDPRSAALRRNPT